MRSDVRHFAIKATVCLIFLVLPATLCQSQDIEFRLSQDLDFRDYPTDIRLGSRIQQGFGQSWFYTDINVPIHRWREGDMLGENEILFFFNPKVTISDYPTDEENIGVGFRYLQPSWILPEGYIAGVNLFYDTALSRNDIRFDRLGLGLEFLSLWFDARANYYMPNTGKKLNVQSYAFDQTAIVRHDDYEEAVGGFDVEGGIMLPYVSEIIETRVYGGMYTFDSDLGVEVEGTKGRIEIRPNRSVSLIGEMRDDDYFGDEYYVGIAVSFEVGSPIQRRDTFSPERLKDRWRFGPGYRNLVERMTEPVVREQDMVTVERRRTTSMEEVIFVDNSNDGDAAEDGSLDHPHNTLADAIANPRYKDGIWIYVDQGDGTATGYTGNYTLGTNITLWGEGFEYLGLAGGAYPTISGGGVGNVITMGEGSTIMGFNITNGGTSGVYAANTTGFRIRYNTITSAGASGIHLLADGVNTLAGTITNNTITNNTTNGILLEVNNTSNMSVTVSRNTISGHANGGIVLDADNTAVMSLNASRNTITGNTTAGVLMDGAIGTTISADLGGGTLGSAGYNSIYGNGIDLDADGNADGAADGDVNAMYNWWGISPPAAAQFDRVQSSEYSGYLDAAP